MAEKSVPEGRDRHGRERRAFMAGAESGLVEVRGYGLTAEERAEAEREAHDWWENTRSIEHGYRILSAYRVGEGKVWIITEASREVTTLLLPEEY